MDKQRVLEIFQKSGALLEGHFLLTSGRHSGQYMQCAKVFQYPEYTQELTQELALAFQNNNVDMVIGPAVGGIILSYEMGKSLGVTNIFAERQNGEMTLRRGFEIPQGARILVVEDVITTGGSVKEVIDLVVRMGGKVVGVGAFLDRSNGKVDFGVDFHCILALDIKSYLPKECPLCKKGIPLVKPGSRDLPTT
ncbi:MAG TPA: orotate phosphoribosyltransferase [Clostridia bacterium]|nr:orotate phosphoribosyltransferase [Clostridia bacterium]